MIKGIKKYLKEAQTGLISGSAENDPSAIANYSLAGAMTGFSQLWLMIIATPMLLAVQSMCARIGDVKKMGLSAVLKSHYSFPLVGFATLILAIINTITIGADILGIALAVNIFLPIGYNIFIVPVTLVIWLIIVFKDYKSLSKYFIILSFISAGYIVSTILSKPDWLDVLREIIFPKITLDVNYLSSAVAIMGATLSPYLFFWQSNEETEERKKTSQHLEEAKKEETLLAPGFVYSQVITLFIMISSAHALFGKGTITNASDLALALEPLAGGMAKYLFALGLIASGFLAVPVLSASTAYAVSELFGWKDHLTSKIKKEKGFYSIITLTLFFGIIISQLQVNPVQLILISQILAGVLGPIIIILIIIISNDKKIMGKYTNNTFDNFFGLLSVIIMVLSSAFLLWNYIPR